jgi:hypothetical protein
MLSVRVAGQFTKIPILHKIHQWKMKVVSYRVSQYTTMKQNAHRQAFKASNSTKQQQEENAIYIDSISFI